MPALWRILVLLGLTAFISTVGCGPQMATVTGNVTVDGQPLKAGVISYSAADGSGEWVTATIADGKYELSTTLGNKVVQISAPVSAGTRKEYNHPDAPSVEITEESLPDRYHSKSELTFEVKSGANTKDWSVESIKK